MFILCFDGTLAFKHSVSRFLCIFFNQSKPLSLHSQIASYVCKSAMDTAVLQRSLAILESMVLNSQDLYQKVAQEITIGQLIPHLQGYGQLIDLCKCSYQIEII